MKIWNFTMVPVLVLAHATLPELSDISGSQNEGPSKSAPFVYPKKGCLGGHWQLPSFPPFSPFPHFPLSLKAHKNMLFIPPFPPFLEST